jgi:biotin carboxyl carrier protein
LSFYAEVEARLDCCDWAELAPMLAVNNAPVGFEGEIWQQVQAAHHGFQLGMAVLSLLPYLADAVEYFSLAMNPDLSIEIPEKLKDKELQVVMAKILVPPPVAKSDEIVAASGGMFYSREAPGMDPFVIEGTHFNQGDALYIVEVMKMFNKVHAPFAGTITKVLVDTDGLIIKKGDPLFKVEPDEEIVVEDPADIAKRMRAATDGFLTANK